MSKFGALINTDLPVLLDFYTDWNEDCAAMHAILRDVAAVLGDSAKVVKIDVDKNLELAQALHIKTLPTFMIYQHGVMRWRQSGGQDADTLIGMVSKYTTGP